MDIPLTNGTILRGIPEGTTDSQIRAKLRRNGIDADIAPVPHGQPWTAPQSQANGVSSGIGPSLGGMYANARGAIRGFRDIAQGAMQAGVGGLNAIGVVSDDTESSLNRYVDESIRNYEAGSGSQTGRMVGQTVATLPVAGLSIPGVPGAAGRVLSNAVQGAAIGAMQPTTDDSPSRTQNVLAGAAAGAVIPEVMRGALAVIGKAASWVKPTAAQTAGVKSSDMFAGDLSPHAKDQLAKAGISWDDLPDQTKANVRQWVLENADKSTLTPVEAVRLGIFDAVGAKPTKAMLTQSFDDFAAEDMLAHQKGGEPVRRAYQDFSTAIGERLEDMSLRAGGTADRSVAGLRTVDALQAGRDETRQAVNAAYAAARESSGAGNKISFSPVRQYLKADDAAIMSSRSTRDLRDGVESWLREQGAIGPGARPLTVEKVEAFKQWVNERWDPREPQLLRMIRKLQNAADESVMRAGKGDVFETARTAYKLGREVYQDKQLVRDLLEQTNPIDRKIAIEDAWDAIVKRSDVTQLADLKSTLQKGSRVTMGPNESETVARGNAAWRDIQSSTLEWIADKSRSAEKGPNDSAIFVHGKMKAAIDQIGPEKLRIILGNDGYQSLKQIQEAIRLAKPIKGTTNPSGSGNRVIQFFQSHMPRMFGAAIGGGATGSPVGAAAGAAVADSVTSGARAMSTGRAARTAVDAERAIRLERSPSRRLGDIAPPGQLPAVGGIRLRDMANDPFGDEQRAREKR